MFSREKVKSKLFEIADGLGIVDESEEKKITVEGMDSIQFISMIVEIEECFDIEVPDEFLVPEFFEDEEHLIDIIMQLMCEHECL